VRTCATQPTTSKAASSSLTRRRGPARSIAEIDHPLLELQKTIGNQAVLRRLDRGGSSGAPQDQRCCATCESGEQTLPDQHGDSGPPLRHERRPVPSHVAEVSRSPGQSLDPRIRIEAEARFGHDFGRVRVHTDDKAAASASALHARAYALGQQIAFGAGRYDPSSARSRALVTHELAHVVEQQTAGREALQLDSELEAFPEAERTKVQVLNSLLDQAGQATIDDLYLHQQVFPIPADRTIQFGASVAKFRQKGLTGVVGSLTTPAPKAANAFLPRNSAIDLAIPAARAVFRFTRFDHAPAAGAPAGSTTEIVLVEQVGEIPIEPRPMSEAFPGPFSEADGPLPPYEARRMSECEARWGSRDLCRFEVLGIRPPGMPEPSPVVLKAETVAIGKLKIRREQGWKETEWNAVVQALTALPNTARTQVSNTKFLRLPKAACTDDQVAARTCDPNWDAVTDPIKNTITFFDSAFTLGTTRFGMADKLQSTLTHEIGHLADFRPLGTAWSAYQRSGNQTKLLSARSHSGSGWKWINQHGKRTAWYTELEGGANKGTFREAAIQDGLHVKEPSKTIESGGVTKYGETSWRELFAESFALYMDDPDLLKAIRPHVFDYLKGLYPN
jgi:Domain of unknown function (DUF4157)